MDTLFFGQIWGFFKLLNFIKKIRISTNCRLKRLKSPSFSAFQSLGGQFLESRFLNMWQELRTQQTHLMRLSVQDSGFFKGTKHWEPDQTDMPLWPFECRFWECLWSLFLAHFIRFLFHLQLPNPNKILNWVFCRLLITKKKSSQCYIVLAPIRWWLVLLARAFRANPILAPTRKSLTRKNIKVSLLLLIWPPV